MKGTNPQNYHLLFLFNGLFCWDCGGQTSMVLLQAQGKSPALNQNHDTNELGRLIQASNSCMKKIGLTPFLLHI